MLTTTPDPTLISFPVRALRPPRLGTRPGSNDDVTRSLERDITILRRPLDGYALVMLPPPPAPSPRKLWMRRIGAAAAGFALGWAAISLGIFIF